MRPSALIPPLLAAAVLAACVPLPGNRSLARRAVAGKQGENVLVAHDGSWCRVTAAAFARAQIGDDHTCAWQEVGADGSGRAIPDARPGRTRLPAVPRPPGVR
jgi:hypothetical protein